MATAASIIETKSQSGSRGTASISGKPHQHISIAERIGEALSQEEVSTEMKDETPTSVSSGSGVQGDTEYHFTRSSTKCDQVTIVWDIKDDRYNIVARIELHISIKPLSLYLYRNSDGVHAQQHVATMKHHGRFNKWTMLLPDNPGLEILMGWGEFEYNRVHYRWGGDLKLHGANGKIVGNVEMDRGKIKSDIDLALRNLTLWNGLSNMTNVALITSLAACIDEISSYLMETISSICHSVACLYIYEASYRKIYLQPRTQVAMKSRTALLAS